MQLFDKISLIKKRIETFAETGRGRLLLKVFQWVFLAGILLWLGLQLYEIGWEEIWQNLPVEPLFYVIFLWMFLSVPIADIIIYRYTWTFNVRDNLSAFIKKRILNTDVVGYSGEVYFFTWARNNINLSDIRIGETIRDYNILSALASNFRAIVFLGIFALLAKEELVKLLGRASTTYFILAGIVILIIIPLAVRFRRYIFVTSLKQAKVVFGIYFLRIGLGTILQIVMWEVVIPEVSLITWIIYAAVSILISRIPTSNKKLVFVGVGVEMSASLGIPEAAMFGLLMSVAALEKILNFMLFLFFSIRSGVTAGDQEVMSRPEMDNV